MKQKLYSLTASLFTKLALVAALIVGWGNAAMAEEWKLTFESGIPTGWTASNYNIQNDVLTPSNSYSVITLTSSNLISIGDNQRIIVKAKSTTTDASTSGYVYISISNDPTFPSGSTTTQQFSKKDYIYNVTHYISFISDPLTTGDFYIQIKGSYVTIESIELCQNKELELTENEPTVFLKTNKQFKLKYTPKDGWNTLLVPFQLKSYSLNFLPTIFGEGYQAFTFGTYDDAKQELTFTSIGTNSVNENTPLLVYIETASEHQNGISIDLGNYSVSFKKQSNISTTNNGITFQGTYAPKAAGTLTNCYGVTQDGRIAKAGDGATMKGYRAYFTGLPTSGAVKMMVINSDTPTDVGLLQMAEGADKAVYNLSGQKVKNVTKGLYIMNGKKVVVK